MCLVPDMSQIMWMLSLLPDWFWPVLIIGGAVAIAVAALLKRIPVVGQYNILIHITGMVALLLGVWMQGGAANEAKWQALVADLEAKIKDAEERSLEVNTVVKQKVITKTVMIKQKADTIIKYVDRPVVQEVDNKCAVPVEIIDIHNEATEMNLLIDKQMTKAIDK
jgi:hypothetical protein